MIKMKKFICMILCAISIMPIPTAAFAANRGNGIIGNIYSTDILAFVNDVPVPSYNIGGKTAIILEDLSYGDTGISGIWCAYDDSLRTFLVSMSDFWVPEPVAPIERGKVGKIVGRIYETDIATYVNGLQIEAFSLNGKMAVAIEDLCAGPDDFGYSPYNMRCVWDAGERTISLYYLYSNSNEIMELMGDKPLSVRIENDKVDIVVDYFYPHSYGGWSDGNFDPPPRYPVYYGGKEIALGFWRSNIHFYIHDDGQMELVKNDGDHLFNMFYDIAAMKEIIDAIEVLPPTYEQVLQHYTVDMWGTVWDRVDTEDCTFLYISQCNPHGSSEFLVRIAKNGEYHDYSKDFESVSYWGNKHFDDVKITEDKVTFSYDKYYVIDLKTGEMKPL